MNADAVIALVLLLFGWSVVSGRLERLDLTGPIVFVTAGLILCNGPWAIVDVNIESHAVHGLAEVTLALLLFADAARVDLKDLRHGAGLPIRLLAIGLPLTFTLGAAAAAMLLTDLPWELAALLGAVLAPTDAALSASVVADERLPETIRRSLNVESGLNDGIATPAVTGFIAAAAAVIGVGALKGDGASGYAALADLLGGVAIGVALGYLGGAIVARAKARKWMAPGSRRISVLMLAVSAFLVAQEAGVNYFVAAFVGGIAFRTGMGKDDEEAIELPELLGRVLALSVWFIFGASLLLDGLDWVGWQIAAYAVLSLSVVRMMPVALSMIGAGFSRPTVLFVGWFGPRGLASVVFGLLIVEELPAHEPRVQTVLSTIVLTVLLSVLAHGITGRPLSAWMQGQAGASDHGAERPHIRPRSTFGRRASDNEIASQPTVFDAALVVGRSVVEQATGDLLPSAVGVDIADAPGV